MIIFGVIYTTLMSLYVYLGMYVYSLSYFMQYVQLNHLRLMFSFILFNIIMQVNFYSSMFFYFYLNSHCSQNIRSNMLQCSFQHGDEEWSCQWCFFGYVILSLMLLCVDFNMYYLVISCWFSQINITQFKGFHGI